MSGLLRRGTVFVLALCLSACASAPPKPGATPTLRYPEFPVPEVPAALKVQQDVRDRQMLGWQRLQAGDTRAATREFTELLTRSPEFYPAETGLGFVALAERQYPQAVSRFAAAIARDARYIPALTGQVQANVALGNYDEAVAAMEKLTVLDPKRDRSKVIEAMERHLALDAERITVKLDGTREQDRRILADLYRHAHVVSHVADEHGITVEADVPRRWLPRFQLAKASA